MDDAWRSSADRSSSSIVAAADLRGFVERSLTILAAEAPASYDRLARALAGHAIRVFGHGESFRVGFDVGRVACGPARGDEAILASIDKPTILALVDGAVTLEQTLREDRFVLKTAPALAVLAFDGLAVYLRGAVRCPSFPGLLAELRSSSPTRNHHELRS